MFLADREVLGGGDAAEDELRGFGGCGKGGDVCDAAALDAEEGEHEGEDRGQDGHADVHVELEGADDAGHDEGDDEAETPFPGADLVFWKGKVLDVVGVGGGLGVLLQEGRGGLAALLLVLGDASCGCLPGAD